MANDLQGANGWRNHITSEGWPHTVALVPARTDTRWFELARFSAACFWRGRIKFLDPDTDAARHPAPFPSAFLYWGPDKYKFASVFQKHGEIWLR